MCSFRVEIVWKAVSRGYDGLTKITVSGPTSTSVMTTRMNTDRRQTIVRKYTKPSNFSVGGYG